MSDCQACIDRYDLEEAIAGIIYHLSSSAHILSDAERLRYIESVFARIDFPPEWVVKTFTRKAASQIGQQLETWRKEYNDS